MTVIDEYGTRLTGHAATVYHSDHPELIEINPMEFIHPEQQSVTKTLTAEELGLLERASNDAPTSEAWAADMSQAEFDACHKPIPIELYDKLNYLGLIPSAERSHNIGDSNYSKQLIQPWTVMLAYQDTHNYLELDIIKRILRSKSSDSRLLDYQKCQHILDELIRVETLKEQQ